MAPPSLPRVPRVVPPAHRYYETLRLPAAHLAALRFLRLAIPSFRPWFVPTGSGRESWINLELVSRAPVRQSTMETTGSPKFPGDPYDHSPCSSTPAGPDSFCGTKCKTA